MHPRAAIIQDFYAKFSQRDAEGMAALYTDDVTFSDPVFPDLRGEAARDMWRMLCGRATDLVIELAAVEADDEGGRARWEARYTFSTTGRPVHNVVDATFEFRGDQIVTHRDHFDLWRWARQALGPTGLLLGRSPIVRQKVQATAAEGLAAFRRR